MSLLRQRLIFILALTCLSSVLRAQDLGCAPTDALCWDRQQVEMCRVEGATIDSCSNWLQALEQSPAAVHPNVRLSMGSANFGLAGMTSDETERAQYRDRAKQIYRAVVEDDPANTGAWLGLSSLAETREQRANLLREAAATDPTDDGVLGLLANVLFDPLERAVVLEQGYSVAPTETRKLYFARNAVTAYEIAGAADRAAALRARVRTDLRLDDRLGDLADPKAASPDRVGVALEEACKSDMLQIFGAASCLENIQTVLEAAEEDTAFLDSASRGIQVAARGSLWLQIEDPQWRQRFESALDALIDTGVAPVSAYTTHAFVTQSTERRVQTMRAAAVQFPLDGEIAFGLGLAEFDAGNRSEAIQALSQARDSLPESRHEFIDQMLSRAYSLPE